MISVIPTWLANLEMEVDLALVTSDEAPDYWLFMRLLDAYSHNVMMWLDTHHVEGHPDHLALANRIFDVWNSASGIRWLALNVDTHPAIAQMLAVAKRLTGLLGRDDF